MKRPAPQKWEIHYRDKAYEWEIIEAVDVVEIVARLGKRKARKIERIEPRGPDCRRCKDTGFYYMVDGRGEGGNVYCECKVGQTKLKEREQNPLGLS